jgi:small subunit ribosomal protein S1
MMKKNSDPNEVKSAEQIELEALYAGTFKNLAEGSVVDGLVLSIQRDGVMVDIGYKSAGVIPREEFQPAVFAALKAGDTLAVYLENQEDADGNVILSKEKADRMRIWDEIEETFKKGLVIEGKILSRIKGGMLADIGVKAFLPGSQIDLRPVRDLDHLVGKSFLMKIIKMDHRRGNIIVSRRALLEESRDARRQKTLSSLTEGQVIEGAVKNITEYGAFVDMGGIDGLLHITDMSWGRVGHPSELFSVGTKVSVVVLKYDKETGRVSLGYKQRLPDPWDNVETRYPTGTRITGKVVSLTDYGAFVELEPGVEGLVHISDMSWSREARHPARIVSIGDQVTVVTLNVDRKARKISIGMKQVEENPWESIERKYQPGSKISGKVRSVTDFGVFVGLESGIDGLIHISDISASRHLKHPSEVFKKGQTVEAVILKVDREKERISLGYKQLTPDTLESDLSQKYAIGQVVTCKVTRVAHFGVFVALEENLEGLIHLSEVGTSARLEEAFRPGSEITAKIIRVDAGEKKIGLSIRAFTKDSDRDAMEDYQTRQTPLDQSIGAIAQKKEIEKGES